MAFEKCKYCETRTAQFLTFKYGIIGRSYMVQCTTCHNCTEEYATRDSAFKAWNRENGKTEKVS